MPVALNAATKECRLIPAERMAREDLDGWTVVEVGEDFSWAGKVVDWETLTVVDAPPPVPAAVTPAQIRLAILSTPGLQPVMDAYVADMDAETRIRWEYSTSVSRQDPAVIAAAAWASITDAQLDDLFRLAATKS